MRSKIILLAVLGLMLFLQGCSTCKGAAEGLREDWKSLEGVDGWMRENLW